MRVLAGHIDPGAQTQLIFHVPVLLVILNDDVPGREADQIAFADAGGDAQRAVDDRGGRGKVDAVAAAGTRQKINGIVAAGIGFGIDVIDALPAHQIGNCGNQFRRIPVRRQAARPTDPLHLGPRALRQLGVIGMGILPVLGFLVRRHAGDSGASDDREGIVRPVKAAVIAAQTLDGEFDIVLRVRDREVRQINRFIGDVALQLEAARFHPAAAQKGARRIIQRMRMGVLNGGAPGIAAVFAVGLPAEIQAGGRVRGDAEGVLIQGGIVKAAGEDKLVGPAPPAGGRLIILWDVLSAA